MLFYNCKEETVPSRLQVAAAELDRLAGIRRLRVQADRGFAVSGDIEGHVQGAAAPNIRAKPAANALANLSRGQVLHWWNTLASAEDTLPIASVAVIAVTSVLWNERAGLTFVPELPLATMSFATFAFFGIAMIFSTVWSNRMMVELATYFGLWGIFPIFAVRLNYLSATLNFPLRDTLFARADSALGFDWRTWASVAWSHPALIDILICVLPEQHRSALCSRIDIRSLGTAWAQSRVPHCDVARIDANGGDFGCFARLRSLSGLWHYKRLGPHSRCVACWKSYAFAVRRHCHLSVVPCQYGSDTGGLDARLSLRVCRGGDPQQLDAPCDGADRLSLFRRPDCRVRDRFWFALRCASCRTSNKGIRPSAPVRRRTWR